MAVTTLMSLVLLVGCSHGASKSGTSEPAASARPVAVAKEAPKLSQVESLSATYQLSPSGPLAHPQTIRLPLTRKVPPGWAVVVATAETSRGPWTYLAAQPSADRRTAIFTTTHYSIFTVLGEDVGSLLRFFKTQFLDGLSSGATASATPPSCGGKTAARSGYDVQSSSGSTVYWCFGTDSSGQRILRVVNNRLYPLEIQHAGLAVAEKPKIDYNALSSVSHLSSGNLSILAPGAQIGYRVSLPLGHSASAQTAMDGFGQSLFALQTGLNAMVAILTRFGAGGASKSITAMDDALRANACVNALLAGNPGSILSSCLSPTDMADYYGPVGVLLAPLAAAGGLADFFASEFEGLKDILTSRDKYTITAKRQVAVPVLGRADGLWSYNGQGWGKVRPTTVFNGGDPTGLVMHITWSSWGGNVATGTGESDWVGPNQTVATGTQETVTIVAFNLGTCDGKLMYQAVEWYFPEHGETFDSSKYEDICHDSFVGS